MFLLALYYAYADMCCRPLYDVILPFFVIWFLIENSSDILKVAITSSLNGFEI